MFSFPFEFQQQAASTSVYCATALELEETTGLYFNNCYPCEMSDAAQDDELAVQVFDLCVDMITRRLGPRELTTYADFQQTNLNN